MNLIIDSKIFLKFFTKTILQLNQALDIMIKLAMEIAAI